MERIGLFGGTFNPPHIGHLWLAAAARDALGLDRVIFIPANIPPHKAIPEDSPSVAHRLAMVRLAVRDFQKAEVSDMEIRSAGPSYTAVTVEAIAELHPSAELFLIVGTDMLLSIDTWFKPEVIFKHCRIAAGGRDSGDGRKLKEKALYLAKTYGARVDCIRADALPVSSTELRGLLPSEAAARWLPPEVYRYIKEKRLYLSDGN